MHDPWLSDFLTAEALSAGPFRPHVYSLRYKIAIPLEEDIAKFQIVHSEIPIIVQGPRHFTRTWEHFYLESLETTVSIQAPWDSAASVSATKSYAVWSAATEKWLLDVLPEASLQHQGRAANIAFKDSKVVIGNRVDHVFATAALSFWEHLITQLRTLIGHYRHGAEELFIKVGQQIGKMLEDIDK